MEENTSSSKLTLHEQSRVSPNYSFLAALLQIQVSAITQLLLAGLDFGAGVSAPGTSVQQGGSQGEMGQLGFSLSGQVLLFFRRVFLSALQKEDDKMNRRALSHKQKSLLEEKKE